MTKQELYLKAIDLNPKDAVAYLNLGKTLSEEKFSSRLPDDQAHRETK